MPLPGLVRPSAWRLLERPDTLPTRPWTRPASPAAAMVGTMIVAVIAAEIAVVTTAAAAAEMVVDRAVRAETMETIVTAATAVDQLQHRLGYDVKSYCILYFCQSPVMMKWQVGQSVSAMKR